MLKHPLKNLSSIGNVQTSEFQLCERRLVLSAQLLFDVLGDHALQTHLFDQSVPTEQSSMPIQPQASAAHTMTGWDQVQQQFGLTGKGQTVAVIDSGIAWDHVALGKGFGSGYRVVGGWDFTEENDGRPYDDGPAGFHGTHVAGIIGSDDPMRTGVAPEVDFVALRVFNDAGQGQIGWVEKALQWVHNNRNAFENPITTVNLSIGTELNSNSVPGWATFEDELKQLHDDGIIVTASAGNSFKQYNTQGLSYPAASQYVLPVASVDDNGQISDFSQRSDRVVAAPGRNILSTVPDHLLGRDGKVNDFSTATGTSMAAPYMAGASVLVRQAMEMVGWNNITADSIAEHLRNTADQVFDTLTKSYYDRLDLQQAIDAILPDDNIGNSLSSAESLDLQSGKLHGWINSLQDSDVFRFTADQSGELQLNADSKWLDSLQWTITSDNQVLATGDQDPKTIGLVGGRSYEIRIDADAEIGDFQLNWKYQPDAPSNSEANPTATQLGETAYWHKQVRAGESFRIQAANDGVMSVLWHNPDGSVGTLQVTSDGQTQNDSKWENGELRLDMAAKAGQWFDIRTPGLASDQAELTIVNVLSQIGKDVRVAGTSDIDVYELNLQNSTVLSIGQVEYNTSDRWRRCG
jgi:subtilisin family serine protease